MTSPTLTPDTTWKNGKAPKAGVTASDLSYVRLPEKLRGAVWDLAPMLFPFYAQRAGAHYTYMAGLQDKPLSYLTEKQFRNSLTDRQAALRVHSAYLGEVAFGAEMARQLDGEAAAADFCSRLAGELTTYRMRLIELAGGDASIPAGRWASRVRAALDAGMCPGVDIPVAGGLRYGVVVGAADGSRDFTLRVGMPDGPCVDWDVDVKNYAGIRGAAPGSGYVVIGEDSIGGDGRKSGVLDRSLLVDIRQGLDAETSRRKIFAQTFLLRETGLPGALEPDRMLDLRGGPGGRKTETDIIVVVAGAMIGVDRSDLVRPTGWRGRGRDAGIIDAAVEDAAVKQPCYKRRIPDLTPVASIAPRVIAASWTDLLCRSTNTERAALMALSRSAPDYDRVIGDR